MSVAVPITQKRLRELLEYDLETGIFTNRVFRSPNALKGAVAGTRMNTGYREIRVDGRRYLAHKLAILYVTGEYPECVVDHEDRDISNNRFSNLRRADKSKNAANSRLNRNNSSGFRGVHWRADAKKFRALIKVNYKSISLGYFATAAEAGAAYLAAAIQYFGEFAYAEAA